jgi:hypothetical protein
MIPTQRPVAPPSLIDNDPSPSPRTGNPDKDRVTMFEVPLASKEISLQTLQRYARTGIPDALRPTYWKLLLGYLPLTPADWDAFTTRKKGEFEQLLKETCELDSTGNIVCHSEDERRIDVDIPRTLPTLHFFACDDVDSRNGMPTAFSPTQQSLRRVLYTVTSLNKGLGYVQGMNELVAHLLIAFAGGKQENINDMVEAESMFAFQILLGFLGDNFCRALDFDKDAGVTSTIRSYTLLLEHCDPAVYEHLSHYKVHAEFYAFRWITLLLSQEFQTPDVLCLWDFFFSFGKRLTDALFFTTVAMIIAIREELMEMNSMSQLLVTLQHYPEGVQIREIIDIANSLIWKYGIEQLESLREDDRTHEVATSEVEAPLGPSVGQRFGNIFSKALGSLRRQPQ